MTREVLCALAGRRPFSHPQRAFRLMWRRIRPGSMVPRSLR